ncbi:MAG: tripartite tricarboxylate transporter substrate binding protein [Polaromonas sp.]|nr:tripartite tricarboxylate transporter substrate binding protein [Polaromonas sp.]
MPADQNERPVAVSRLNRRTAIAGTLGSLAALHGNVHAQGEAWPSRPIRLVVPQGAGGGVDIIARVIAPELSASLKQAVIVDNRPGASANIGGEFVARAAADGYTVLFGINQIVTFNPHIFPKMAYDPMADLVPVTQTSVAGYILTVNNDLPVKTLAEFVAYAKKNPGKLSYGSWGPGSAHHLGTELLSQAAGLDMVHIPYKQSPVTDLIAGNIQVLIEVTAAIRPFVNAGSVRPLAYTGPTRHPAWPNLPTLAETYPGIELTGWHGVWLPRGASPALIERFNTEFVRIVKTPQVQKQIADLTFVATGTTPADFQAIITRENKRWGEVIRSRNIRVE